MIFFTPAIHLFAQGKDLKQNNLTFIPSLYKVDGLSLTPSAEADHHQYNSSSSSSFIHQYNIDERIDYLKIIAHARYFSQQEQPHTYVTGGQNIKQCAFNGR